MLFNPFSVIKSIQRNATSFTDTQTFAWQNLSFNVDSGKSLLFFSVMANMVVNSPTNYLIEADVFDDHVEFRRGAGAIGDDLRIAWTLIEYR